MSFVAFPANFAGSFPAVSAAVDAGDFDAGRVVFYLVGPDSGAGFPAPSTQLSVFKVKTSDDARYPEDTVVETAKGWQGRRRVAVATRTYTWSRYTKGALATARDAAQWTAMDGSALRIWSHLVPVDVAETAGFRVPKGRMNARRGTRGVGRENTARATVRGRSVVQAAPVAVAPVAVAPVAVAPVAVAPVAEPVDPSVARFLRLDLDDAPAARAEPVDDDDAGRQLQID